VVRLKEEISILQEYLPEQLGTNEIKAVIEEAIQDLGADGPGDMGRVMQKVMPALKGKADGRLINQMVKESLQ